VYHAAHLRLGCPNGAQHANLTRKFNHSNDKGFEPVINLGRFLKPYPFVFHRRFEADVQIVAMPGALG
jgi:hypothetical protein